MKLRMRAKALASVLLAILFVAPALAEPNIKTDQEAGLYAYITHTGLKNFEALNDTSLAQDYVDGAAIMINWCDIEPDANQYDWTNLDRWIVKTVERGKKLSLGVIAGSWTPEWLYGKGYDVPKCSFMYDRSPPHGICSTIYQPYVWNPIYLREYRKTLYALSRHLKQMKIPGHPDGAAYDALTVIKLSGINLTTEELRINAHPPGGKCNEPNTAEVWAKAGYRPSKIVSAWLTIAADTALAFPGKILSVAIIHKSAFPPISEQGKIDYASITKPVGMSHS